MRAVVLCLALFGMAAAHAGAGRIDYQKLGHTPRWLALLHWNTGITTRGIGTSYVDDPDFFLATNGHTDPVAELRASVVALRKPASQTRCRYPARYKYLAQHLGWHENAPLAHCKKYLQWRSHMPTGQLVLVFPAAYLNSPSSMFGHTLLRLDASTNPGSVWLSQAISFGAQIGKNPNSVQYVWRGLITGYPGQFTVEPYVDKIQEYSHMENRDIWEYTLNMNHDELDWLVRNLWELRNINFDYLFFDENCSLRLLGLIRVARPGAPILRHWRFAELPVNTVRALYKAGMVTGRHFRPSRVDRLRASSSRLSRQQRALAKSLMHDPELVKSAQFQAYTPQQRHLIADVAYQALRFRVRKQPRNSVNAQKSLALLRVIQKNPAPAQPVQVKQPVAPENGHDTKAWTLGLGRRNGLNFMDLSFRMTYHDLLDPPAGFLRGAGIQGFGIDLRLTNTQGVRLQSLDVVNIRSLSPRTTFNKPISWFVHGGYEHIGPGTPHGSLFLQGGPGLSWRLGDLMPYVLATVRLEHDWAIAPAFRIGGGAEAGVLYYGRFVQLGLRARALYFQSGYSRHSTAVTVDVPITKDNAVRVDCSHASYHAGDANSCRLAWRHFFN